MSKLGALHRLEGAFRDWFWETGVAMPDIGILVIGVSRDGCDLQYLGRTPNTYIDWPVLFAAIIKELESGGYSINDAASVEWPSQE